MTEFQSYALAFVVVPLSLAVGIGLLILLAIRVSRKAESALNQTKGTISNRRRLAGIIALIFLLSLFLAGIITSIF